MNPQPHHRFLPLLAALIPWLVFPLLPGCARPAPLMIALPSTTAVRKPIVAAQTHVARSVQIGRQESAILRTIKNQPLPATQARQLAELVAADQAAKLAGQDQLAAALYQQGSLQKDLDARQAQIVAVEKDRAAKTLLVARQRRSLFRWRSALLALFVADFFIGCQIQAGLRWAVVTALRIGAAFVRHLIAFWPVLLAAL